MSTPIARARENCYFDHPSEKTLPASWPDKANLVSPKSRAKKIWMATTSREKKAQKISTTTA